MGNIDHRVLSRDRCWVRYVVQNQNTTCYDDISLNITCGLLGMFEVETFEQGLESPHPIVYFDVLHKKGYNV